MAECNLPLPFQSVKPEEKICKYSYMSWCPTCDRDSPRRRTKSETFEPCRRKGKEMKTFTPKKYDRRQEEYENMELDYDMKDLRLDRIRSNLCELPTTYITNNCQLNANMSNLTPKLSSSTDFLEFGKLDYENSYPLEDGIFESMADKMRREDKLEPMKPHYQNITLSKTLNLIDSRSLPKPVIPPKKRATSGLNDKSRVCSARHLEERDHHFDTHTFFDKQFDAAEVKARYCRELELLREKLKNLRSHKYSPIKPPTIIKNLDIHKDRNITNTNLNDITIIENVTSPKIDGRLPNMKKGCLKISVKTKVKKDLVKTPRNRIRSVRSPLTEYDDSSDLSDLEDLLKEDFQFEEVLFDHEVCKPSKKEIKIKAAQKTSEEKTPEPKLSSQEKRAETVKETGDAPFWPIRESLFPHIPPYVRFNIHDGNAFNLPAGRRYMKWKLSTITPIVVRKTLLNTGFRLVRSEFSREDVVESNEWLGTWGKHMKSPVFKTLKSSQRLNHFAGTFQLGRKDRLWKNLQRLMHRYGTKEFGIIPQTFVLPQDLKALKQCWECKDGTGGEKWIVKPPASARGVGIKVINKWSQLPKQTSLVVQKYISDPYLINGSKFDLRLYVLVTSFNPLRIYIYPEGLVRFASAKYSDSDKDLKDRYMHLTNYSINKLSSQYTANEDANSCQGHKWTLSKLWEFMELKGIDSKLMWNNLKNLVIKTMICGESPITQLCAENVHSRYNCYELFGVDVLLDQRLKPWLLEVNISPSLHSTSPLDLHVKGPLVQTLFNIAQFHFPQKIGKIPDAPAPFDWRLYTTNLTSKETNKHNYYVQMERREDYLSYILDTLTGDDVRVLTQAEDELVVKGPFERIFPTSATHKYLQYMPPRYYNRLFDAWEHKYENNRKAGIERLRSLCAKKIHLKVAPQSTASKNSLNTNHGSSTHQAITPEGRPPLQHWEVEPGHKTDYSAQSPNDNH